MKLSDLLTDHASLDAQIRAIEVTGITADSRAVKRGDLFVAVPGTKADGMIYAEAAAKAGAVAVIGEKPPQARLPGGTAFVPVANARRALSMAASRFYP